MRQETATAHGPSGPVTVPKCPGVDEATHYVMAIHTGDATSHQVAKLDSKIQELEKEIFILKKNEVIIDDLKIKTQQLQEESSIPKKSAKACTYKEVLTQGI